MDIQNKPASSIVRWRINLSNLQDTGIQDGDQFSLDGLSTRFRLKFRYFDENFEYWLYVVNMGFEKNVKCTVNFWAENRYREKSYETETTTATFNQSGDNVNFSNIPRLFRSILRGPSIHPRSTFKNHSKSKFYNDIRTICCQISYEILDELYCPNLVFRQNLWKSYSNGLYDGVKIKAEEKEFNVSKTILTANSEVFERMLLTENCVEARTGVIEMKKTKAAVIQGLIEFMHLGRVENLEPVAVDLLKLSDKYKMEELKIGFLNLCAKSLSESLTGETLFDTLVLAYKYSSDRLKKLVFMFLAANSQKEYFTELIRTDKWFEFWNSNEDLANEISTDVFKNMKTTY